MKFASNVSASKREPVSLEEFHALIDNLEAEFDYQDRGDDSSAFEIAGNLESLSAIIDNSEPAFINWYARQHEDLSEMYGDGLETFKANVKAHLDAAEEGFVGEWLGDGLIKAIVGRKAAQLEYLKEAVPECIKRIEECDDKKIESRAKVWIFGRVMSRFLPSVETYHKNADALIKMAAAAKGVNSVNDFDPEKFTAILKDTTYYQAGKARLKGQENTDWGYIFIKSLPALPYVGFAAGIHNAFFWDPLKPVSTRGWKDKQTYIDGLKKAEGLVAAMGDMEAAAKRILGERPTETPSMDTINKVKAAAAMLRFGVAESGHLGRGICVAAKKVTSGFFGRVGRNIIHA